MYKLITKVTAANTAAVKTAMQHLQAGHDWMNIVLDAIDGPSDQWINDNGEISNYPLAIFQDKKTGDIVAIPEAYGSEGTEFTTVKGVAVVLVEGDSNYELVVVTE